MCLDIMCTVHGIIFDLGYHVCNTLPRPLVFIFFHFFVEFVASKVTKTYILCRKAQMMFFISGWLYKRNVFCFALVYRNSGHPCNSI